MRSHVSAQYETSARQLHVREAQSFSSRSILKDVVMAYFNASLVELKPALPVKLTNCLLKRIKVVGGKFNSI